MRQYGQTRVGFSAAGLMKIFEIRHATKPMMMKLIAAAMKSPTPNFTEPTLHVAFCHSPPGPIATTIGMMKSSTTALTSVLRAVATTTAIASATTFCFNKNSLNSFSIGIR